MSGKAVADLKAEASPARAVAMRVAANTPGLSPARNPGMRLDLGFLESMRNVNRSALERRVGSLMKRRSIKGDTQAAWLLRAISLMDLTTLNSNDTDERFPKWRNDLGKDTAR